MRRAWIAGCGDVGSRLGLRLAAAGWEVWGLRRSPKRIAERLAERGGAAAIHPLQADLGDPASLRRALDEAGPPALLAYTAAADASEEAAYRRAYVEGPANVLGVLAEAGALPERGIFTSSTAVYGQDDGEWVDETSPTRPTGFRGEILREGEGVFRSFLAASGEAVVARLAGIYGPGRTRLLDAVRAGRARADDRRFTNRIHADDCAGMLAHLAALPAPEAVYLGVDAHPAPDGEVKRWLAERLGAPPPEPAEPPEPEHGGRNKRCSSRRLLASGYRLLYPSYREGYAAVLSAGE